MLPKLSKKKYRLIIMWRKKDSLKEKMSRLVFLLLSP